MPKPRYLAPWHQPDVMEAVASWEAAGGGKVLDAGMLASLRGKPAIYHCISRVVDRRFVFGTPEKEQFVAFLRLYEEFCQVRVLSYAVMSNHFHILLEVPARPADGGQSWSDAKLLKHLRGLYAGRKLREIEWQLGQFREQGNERGAEELRQSFFYRMWDLSEFMKTLKQRFARWFNKRHERKGTLWEERFKSVLVEDGHAARVMSAYIDLNPVRAGLVKRSEDYRWCSFGEAVAGRRRAREGLQRVLFESQSAFNHEEDAAELLLSWRKTAQRYREVLGAHRERDRDRERAEAKSAEQTAEASSPASSPAPALAPAGSAPSPVLSETEALLCRVRYFIDGLVIGSQRYVDGLHELTRPYFGPKRKDGARKLRGIQTELRSMRDLQPN